MIPTTATTYKKKYIPAALRRLVWHTYIGEEHGKALCWCCSLSAISQMSFHCGHVVSEKNGGPMTIENLRPICQNCNSSMRTQNMETFKAMLTTTADANANGPIPMEIDS